MNSYGNTILAILAFASGLSGGCASEKKCEPRVSTYCSDGITYWTNSCGDFEEIKEHCECGCIADHSDCKLCDCESHTDTTCIEGVLYWTDSCDQPEEVIEECECGCEPDGKACKEDCICTPSCEGKQCGSDGCGDNHNCGQCQVGWACNRIGACVKPETCNNGRLETYEECEGFDLRAETCISLGYDAGELTCADDCILDASECRKCGNDSLEPGELCDGDNFGQATCQSMGFVGGTLGCATDCLSLLFDDCHNCGDGNADYDEACDGEDLKGESCESIGWGEGRLACLDDCRLDTSGCSSPCDNSGDCEICSDCALNYVCGDLLSTCANTSGCLNYLSCIANCEIPIQTCLDQCAVDFPDGKTEGDDLASCIYCDSCANDCSAFNAGCP